MLVSVAICTYNGERFVREQLDSILAQSYTNIEVIIYDDSSTDGTLKILQEYKNDKRVKIYLNEKNVGATESFGKAIALCSGEFIALSDQDDIWLPQKLEKMYQAMGTAWLTYSDSELVNEEGNDMSKRLSQLRRMYSGKNSRGFVFYNVVWGHAILIHRKLVPHVLPIPAAIPHDIWIGFKATTITGIQYLDIPLTKYRQHSETVTKTIAEKAIPRSNEKRFKDFEEKLNWIKVMRDNERPEEKLFYNRLYELYSKKANGKYVWELFFFLLKNRRELFMFTRKKWISQLVEIFKQARGESR